MINVLTRYYEATLVCFDSSRNDFHNDLYTIYSIPFFRIKGYSLVYLVYVLLASLKQASSIVYSRYLYGCFIYLLKPNKVFMEWHRDEWNDSWFTRYITRVLITSSRTAGFVFITDALKANFVKKYSFNKKPLLVLPDAANKPSGSLVNSRFLSSSKLNVGYVGSFQPGKGMEIILPLIRAMNNVFFHVVGGSDDECKRYIEMFSSANNVKFYGYVPSQEVESFIKGFDVCLLPNQYSVKTGKRGDIGRFTSPLKMFEYMAHGKPIIASDLTVLREVLSEEFAIFAKPDSIEGWIAAINRVKNDRKLGEQLGKRAREVFEENYTWEKRVLKLKKFIDSTI
jgi:glycosyltransferase involved in cell wall biosynthesis